MEGNSLLLFQIAFVSLSCFSREASMKSIYFEAFSGKKVNEDLNYHKEASINCIHCAFLCSVNGNCSTGSFDVSNKTCQLSVYRVRRPDFSDMLIDVASWIVLSKSECKEGWISIGDSCYIFNEERRNMSDAKKYCEHRGGKLAEPRTIASNELLRSYLMKYFDGDYYYIGLTDMEVEGKFVWISDGKVPVYTAWGPSEPIIGEYKHHEDAVVLLKMKGYKWGDFEPTRAVFSICEI